MVSLVASMVLSLMSAKSEVKYSASIMIWVRKSSSYTGFTK